MLAVFYWDRPMKYDINKGNEGEKINQKQYLIVA